MAAIFYLSHKERLRKRARIWSLDPMYGRFQKRSETIAIEVEFFEGLCARFATFIVLA